jgi:hypothetical protein
LKTRFEIGQSIEQRLTADRLRENNVRCHGLKDDELSLDLILASLDDYKTKGYASVDDMARGLGFGFIDASDAQTTVEARRAEFRRAKCEFPDNESFLEACRDIHVCAANVLTMGLSAELEGIPIQILTRNDDHPNQEKTIPFASFGTPTEDKPVLQIGLSAVHYEPIFRV